jgi:hypothetical protein
MSYAESKRVPYSEPLDPAKAALARLENKLRAEAQGVTRPGPDVARERFSRLRRGGPAQWPLRLSRTPPPRCG